MARDLQADQATLAEILSLAQNRDIQRAADLAERTLAGGFEHPLLFNVLATRHEQQGNFEASCRLLQRAVAIAPGDVAARHALALCLLRLERPAEALSHVDEILKAHPDLPFVHASKGGALIGLGSLGLAEQSHRRAVELEPGNLAALAALASIATQRGQHADARLWAERALAIAPGFPDAVLSLASAELASGATQRAEILLQQLILDSRAGATDKARAAGLLGDVLDAEHRYREAFAAYSSCNEALRTIHRRYAAGTAVREYAASVGAAFSRLEPGTWPELPSPGSSESPGGDRGAPSAHVFLIGFPRSGTTLLEVVLDGHPRVASGEELDLMTPAVVRYLREPVDLAVLAAAPEAELAPFRAAYWQAVRAAGIEVDGRIFIDKYPLNTLKLPLIARLFPEARILFACRDPRDVVLSCYRRRFKMNPAMYELLRLEDAAAFYDAVMAFADRVRPALGLPWHTVRYEDLIADLAAETQRICAFLGIEWMDGLGEFAKRAAAREQATPSTAQLRVGLDRTGAGHWRHYEGELAAIMPTLSRWVARFAYAG
jgi:Flp pilus assembly protein TadD